MAKYRLSRSFNTAVKPTERVVEVAAMFGLGLDQRALVGLSHRPAALALLALEELVNCFDELSPDDYETVEGFLDELRGLEYQGE